MKFGTFLIIEACDKLGYRLSINHVTKDISLYDKKDNLLMNFIATNTDSISDEFYYNLRGNLKPNRYHIRFSSELHIEIKRVRSDYATIKRWEVVKARTSGLNKIFS